MQHNQREILLAGAEYTDAYTDLQWVSRAPHGNWAIRLLGFVLRKSFRRGASRITFDKLSFEQATAQIPPDHLVVLAPTHRSMMDFLVCSYLCFAHPELKISIPYIAADLQLGKLPFLGWLLKQAYAFYIKRGQGKADPELNAQLRHLVTSGQTLEIFIEGTRSRARQCLPPKRGLLRALQQTGVSCTLLPITITYDRVPEEQALMKELQGGPKPLMRLGPLLRWSQELIKGQVQIGRVHLVCGEPVAMASDSDVHAVSQAVMQQLQQNTHPSTYHLRAFLQHHPELGYSLDSLTALIEARGGTVLNSPLEDVSQVALKTEYTLRYQWMHLFFPDLLAYAPHHPVVLHHVQTGGFSPRSLRPASALPPDPQLLALLQALFRPLEQAYAQLLDVASQHAGLRFAHPKAFVMRHPDCFLPMVEEALAHLTAAKLLIKNDAAPGFKLGEAWATQSERYRASLWDKSPSPHPSRRAESSGRQQA
ncbi:MAG: 1-acyl-sn-glycerol-3-phosphate acyltransferase [Candidatus Sericytochromatia bacterium]